MFNNKYLLAALFLTVGLFNVDLVAQDESADDVEEVIVTGTRLKADGFEAVSPVTVVTTEEIDNFGAVRIEDVLNTFPQIETSATNFEPGGADGTGGIDLRGLGQSRTLVLLNGRRLQPGTIWSETPDVGQIPVSLLERVDVLTGGASAVYGSDAVAGVVNFVTRRVNGVEISLSKAGYMHDNGNAYMEGLMDAKGFDYPTGRSKDGETDNFEIVMGTDFAGGKGNVSMYLTRNSNKAVYNRDRVYAACGLSTSGTSCGGSANTPIPHFDIYPIIEIGADQLAGWADEDGVNDYSVGDTVTVYEQDFWSVLTADGSLIPDDGSRYNYAAVAQLMNPSKRTSMGAIGDYQVNDTTTIYAEANFSSFNQIGGIAESGTFFNDEYQIMFDNDLPTDEWKQSVLDTFVAGANYGYGGDYAPTYTGTLDTGITGDEYCLIDAYDEVEGSPTEGDPIAKSTQCGQYVGWATYIGKRNVEGGPRQDHISSDAYRFVLGVKGEVGYRDWEYDVSYTYGNSSSASFYLNDLSAPALVNAVEVDQAGYNVFEYQGVTPEEAAGVGITGGMIGTNDLKTLIAFVTGTTQYQLPNASSPIGFVAGIEKRAYTFDRTPDTAYADGLLLGFGGSVEAIKGTIKVDEFYFESNIPVNDQLFADVAYRRSDYDVTGTNNTSRLSLTYLLNDNVKFRVGFNEAERAPSIASLFTPESQSLWEGDDPCAGNDPEYTQAQCALTGMTAAQYGNVTKSPASQYYNRGGGNPNLESENAETLTAGVVFSLPVLNGIDASIDYWEISVTDSISSIDEETILELCATQGQYCEEIKRNAAGSLWLSGGYVNNKLQNVAEQEWAGVDISAVTSFDVYGGTLSVKTVATNMMDKLTALIPGNATATYDCVGVWSNKCFPTPEWRTRTSFVYDQGANWTVGATIRTMSGIDNGYPQDTIAQAAIEDGYNLLDVNATYEVNDKVTLRANINNLLDEEPPVVGDVLSNGYGNTMGGFYDSLGMYWNLTVNVKL